MVVAAVNPLLLLLVLACPIGMGLMMLFMGRGMRMGGGSHGHAEQGEADARSLADLKAEQARISERIEALEGHEEMRREPTEAR